MDVQLQSESERGIALRFLAALTRGFWHPMTSSIQNLSSFRRMLIYHDTMETRGMVGVLNPPRLWLVEEHICLKITNILPSHNSDSPHWIANVAPNLVLFEELIAADESKAWKIMTWWGVNYRKSKLSSCHCNPCLIILICSGTMPVSFGIKMNLSLSHFHVHMESKKFTRRRYCLQRAVCGTCPKPSLEPSSGPSRNLPRTCYFVVVFFPEPLANLPCNLLGNREPGLLPCWSSSPIPPWKHCHTQNYNSIWDNNSAILRPAHTKFHQAVPWHSEYTSIYLLFSIHDRNNGQIPWTRPLAKSTFLPLVLAWTNAADSSGK